MVINNESSAEWLVRAIQCNIPTQAIDHLHFIDRSDYEQTLAAFIESCSPAFVILAGFMRILGPRFVDRFVGRLINTHASLLPKYPRSNTHQRALIAGDSEAGATAHFVTSKLDGGPAIIQASVPIGEKYCADTLAQRVRTIEHIFFPLATQWLVEGRIGIKGINACFDRVALPPHGKIMTMRTSSRNTLNSKKILLSGEKFLCWEKLWPLSVFSLSKYAWPLEIILQS